MAVAADTENTGFMFKSVTDRVLSCTLYTFHTFLVITTSGTSALYYFCQLLFKSRTCIIIKIYMYIDSSTKIAISHGTLRHRTSTLVSAEAAASFSLEQETILSVFQL